MSVRVSAHPSIRQSDSPSVRSPSAHFPHFPPTCFDILSWNFARLCFDVLQIKFDCRHFASIFEGVMPLCELRIKVMCSFPHFSPTCFDILSSNFAYDFVSPYYRSSSSAVNLRVCLWELCPFWNLEYWKYTVFRTFLFHALTSGAQILHMTLFHRTTDQAPVASIFVGVMPLLELRILKIHSFLHFSLTCFDILSWNFSYDFVLLYYRSSLSVVNFCRSNAPFGT